MIVHSILKLRYYYRNIGKPIQDRLLHEASRTGAAGSAASYFVTVSQQDLKFGMCKREKAIISYSWFTNDTSAKKEKKVTKTTNLTPMSTRNTLF